MKTIDLNHQGKTTTIFVDKICYIKEKNSAETIISFGKEHYVTAKISYKDLIEKISRL
ncbi:hypothetical protein [Aestuariibaculum marinum]|uniref:Uncharacterized protein n=1 Tax=Aestuariibaculum marinum TaxID=2683592 RepID=A0A8J6Q007_9FLAO|nr:hypothetical protein [Aestuariibaculum marinum]MBD0825533.1 hypothetical protein [Aestuariibaculum marinum]